MAQKFAARGHGNQQRGPEQQYPTRAGSGTGEFSRLCPPPQIPSGTWSQAGCILVFNTNVTEEQNVVAVPIKRAVKKETKLVVIDPREVELTRYAHIVAPSGRRAPNSSSWGACCVLPGGSGAGAARVAGGELREPGHPALRPPQLGYGGGGTGTTQVTQEAIAEAASLYGQAEGAGAIVYALDNIPGELQRDCVRALIDMALITGHVGKPGWRTLPHASGRQRAGRLGRGLRARPVAGLRIREAMTPRASRLAPLGGCDVALMARLGPQVGPGSGPGRPWLRPCW